MQNKEVAQESDQRTLGDQAHSLDIPLIRVARWYQRTERISYSRCHSILGPYAHEDVR
jgi:hypothetical protein